jgi:hypothetical protein
VKHGLAGRTVVLPKENRDEYRAFCRRMLESVPAETPVEEELAQSIADQYWRMRRVRAVEEAMDERGEASLQELATLGIYQQRINRALKDAEERLREMHAQRKRRKGRRRRRRCGCTSYTKC